MITAIERSPSAAGDFVNFQRMRSHGEVRREATPCGSVILSQLPRGVSRIEAAAPSIKFVLQGEGSYSIGGRTKRLRPGEFILVDSAAHHHEIMRHRAAIELAAAALEADAGDVVLAAAVGAAAHLEL